MKSIYLLFTLAFVVMLASCAAPKPNPEFRECANACTKRQDACMVSASTSSDVSKCNAALDACVASCERKLPRFSQP